MQGSEAPTALSWLRRRGPPLPEAALHKLFRQEAVRLYSPADQRVTRISKGRALAPGTMLLLPKAAVAADEQWGSTQQQAGTESQPEVPQTPHTRQALPPVQEQARGEWVARLQASLLHHDSELIALNKPAGLACQGGSGIAFSLDTLMAEAFGGLPGTRADQLRLVHRLDRQTTGGGGWAVAVRAIRL
jgi:23S rRNA pseudouridine955/2504/2580 synthase